jgi:hypothetical protein
MTLSTTTQLFRCECGWEGHEDDLRSECTFFGTREEPPEYEAFCPQCNTTWENMDEVPQCVSCHDKFVRDEGDNCAECLEAIAEDVHDGKVYDRLMEGRT